VFDDQVHRIFVPEKPEVATPAWRVVTDSPAPNGATALYGEKRESNGDSIATSTPPSSSLPNADELAYY
jgi:hypothetical protein